MIRKPDEDLFKDTTMTFGEHLEELRTCLWRALLGILIGTAVGLYFASDVIEFIKRPMEKALGTFHSNLAIDKFRAELAGGETLPYTLEDVQRLVFEEGLLFEIFYFNQPELASQLRLNSLVPSAPDFDATAEDEGSNAAEKEEQSDANPESEESASAPPAPQKGKSISAADLQPLFLWHRIADDQRIRLIGLSVQDSFTIWIKAGLLVGVTLAAPWVFWQIWSFVAAGLYPHEKKYVHLFLPFSLLLFAAGVAVAFLFVFEPVLNFLLSFYAEMDIDPDQRITDWLSFVLILPLGFGISFQLPLVMLFLERIGIFNVTIYLQKWRIAILVIFVISMILSPGGDPYSMLLMALPLTVLYFGGVMLCKYLPRGRNPFDPA